MLNIRLRAHHGLCIAFFEGKGYNEHFISNMKNVIATLRENPSITIVLNSDIICNACPNNNKGLCYFNEKVNRYDKKVLQLCNLSNDSILTWKTYKALINKNIIKTEKIYTVCSDCQWASICCKLDY